MNKNIFTLRTLIILALLAAIGAVMSAFFSIELPMGGTKVVEISLTPIPVMIAGAFFGPIAGGLVGFIADTSGFFMGVQYGGYNPVFSVTLALFGVIAGLFYMRSKTNSVWKAIGTATVSQVVVSITLNTLAIWLFYGVPIMVLLPTRALSAAVELPVYVVLLWALIKALSPIALRNTKQRAA